MVSSSLPYPALILIFAPGLKLSVLLTGKSFPGISPSRMTIRAEGILLTALTIATEMTGTAPSSWVPSLKRVSRTTSLPLSLGETAMDYLNGGK